MPKSPGGLLASRWQMRWNVASRGAGMSTLSGKNFFGEGRPGRGSVRQTLAEKPRRPTRLEMKHECRRRSRLAPICLTCRKSTFSARVCPKIQFPKRNLGRRGCWAGVAVRQALVDRIGFQGYADSVALCRKGAYRRET